MTGFVMLVGIIGFVTALLDMGMNGSARAGWAPWGLGIAIISAVFVQVIDWLK